MGYELSDADLDEIEQRAARAFKRRTAALESVAGDSRRHRRLVQFGGDTDHDNVMHFEVHLGPEQLVRPTPDSTRSSILSGSQRMD
jgi:hypothetical protein